MNLATAARTHNAGTATKEEGEQILNTEGRGGPTDTYHGVKEFQNSLGVADTRRHRDTERQDRLLHKYLQPSVHPTRLATAADSGYFVL